jgi:hypothetical protein
LGSGKDEAEGEEGSVRQKEPATASLATPQGFFSVPSFTCANRPFLSISPKLSALLLQETGYGLAQGQEMGDQIVEPFPGREMCDFCSERLTTQLYACKNFLVPRTKTALFQHESVGAWAACRTCAELVDGERWSELTDRALSNFIKQHGVPRYGHCDVREQFREIHQLFREHLVKES